MTGAVTMSRSAEALEARLSRIRARLAATSEEETGLRVMLVLAHEALRQQAQASSARPGDEITAISGPTAIEGVSPSHYAELVSNILETVARVVPAGARLLVVSRGDDALLAPGFDAAHFPQGPNGLYAGYYPADSEAAIAHLEQCRAGGAEFLVLPTTSYWWLDYYEALARHLLVAGRALHHDEHCLIFDLRTRPRGEPVS